MRRGFVVIRLSRHIKKQIDILISCILGENLDRPSNIFASSIAHPDAGEPACADVIDGAE
jgi:hypothetical protein